MTVQSPTMLRCERCKAAVSTTQAAQAIRHGVCCGVCGGTLTLWRRQAPPTPAPARHDARSSSPAHRLLAVLRAADGQPLKTEALAQAGVNDPANAIYELERAGHRIERAYTDGMTAPRRFLGYCLTIT